MKKSSKKDSEKDAYVFDSGFFFQLQRRKSGAREIDENSRKPGAERLLPAAVLTEVCHGWREEGARAYALSNMVGVPLTSTSAELSARLWVGSGTEAGVVDSTVAATAFEATKQYRNVFIVTTDPDDLRKLVAETKADITVLQV